MNQDISDVHHVKFISRIRVNDVHVVDVLLDKNPETQRQDKKLLTWIYNLDFINIWNIIEIMTFLFLC